MSVTRQSAAILGGSVAWLEVGSADPSQPTMLLLHGIPSSAELWRGVLEHLEVAGRHAIAIDLPGYGPTTLPETIDHGIAGMVEVVLAMIAAQDLGPVWLVGHDLGGVAAQLLAIEHSEVVARLSITNSPIEASWPPPAMRPVFALARHGAGGVSAGFLPRFVAEGVRIGLAGVSGGRGTWTSADAKRVFLADKTATPDAKRAFARHVLAIAKRNKEFTIRTAPHLGEITVPTQLIWGMRDQNLTWKKVGARWQTLLADPAVTQLPQAGHFLPGECPAQVAAALLAPA